jgi:hypothetical protein
MNAKVRIEKINVRFIIAIIKMIILTFLLGAEKREIITTERKKFRLFEKKHKVALFFNLLLQLKNQKTQ